MADHDTLQKAPQEAAKKPDRKRSNALIASGVGVAALGALGAVAGVVCPLCVVAAPTLIGAGVVDRVLGRKKPAPEAAEPASGGPAGPAPGTD